MLKWRCAGVVLTSVRCEYFTGSSASTNTSSW